jgi:hypothetical protein
MTIEVVENSSDSEGRSLLTLKGRSLEQILDDRVATHGIHGEPLASDTWDVMGTPAFIARYVYERICVEGTIDPGDIIPAMTGYGSSGAIEPVDTLPEPTDYINAEIPVSSVYSAIKKLCDVYDMGFRLLRHQHTSELYFDIYMGSDRTTRQTTLKPVLFSTDFDNLINVSEITSTIGVKNVAYVYSKGGSELVYAGNVDPSVAGFRRRVLAVDAMDIDENITGTQLSALHKKRGAEALAVAKSISVLDGEISQNSEYTYAVDYWLGDLVEMRNSDGLTNHMRVTEQIFVSDGEGERSYPTLAFNHFIMPGTWGAWESNVTWAEESGVWADASS